MSAYISRDGLYRYSLQRDLDGDESVCTFVMLNPSTADGRQNDPTIRRCVRFARDAGYGRLRVVNLYAFRTTDPSLLWLQDDPVGPENNRVLALAFEESDLTIAAWGANARPGRVDEVMAMPFAPRWCLGLTKTGAPRHPLYMPADCGVHEFRAGARP
jgi:hypothetical protein